MKERHIKSEPYGDARTRPLPRAEPKIWGQIRFRAAFDDEVGSLAWGLLVDRDEGRLPGVFLPSDLRRWVRFSGTDEDAEVFERLAEEWSITKARVVLRRAGMDV